MLTSLIDNLLCDNIFIYHDSIVQFSLVLCDWKQVNQV